MRVCKKIKSASELKSITMINSYPAFLLLFAIIHPIPETTHSVPPFNSSMRSVKQVPLPEDFERIPVKENSFAAYLQNLPLRKDKTVYLYNQQPKSDQSLHYAVIDISTGDKDLQQCADAIMRLRAEYFFAKKLYDSIRFLKTDRSFYQYSRFVKQGMQNNKEQFMGFMQTVFMNCGTYNLEQQLKPVADFAAMQIGDVLIKGGAPGHAEIVVDIAVNKQTGKKIYLLAEGYMPAQDIHVLLNPVNTKLGPWYEIDNDKRVVTVSWIFSKNQLRCW
jgi:hypothetical protein